MIRFGDTDLFGSGPSRTQVGGLSLRHVLHESPGGQGVRLSAQGTSGRTIHQAGDLYADNPQALASQTAAIEALLDGQPRRWRDGLGHDFSDVVMLTWEPGPLRRVGTRWAVSYRITYLQCSPTGSGALPS